MAKFSYVALDAKGKEVSGQVDSENTTDAIGRIREKGLFPTSVTEARQAAAAAGPAAAVGRARKRGLSMDINLPWLGGGKVPSKVLTAFTRQLATLIDAGLPLLRGLTVLRKQERHPVLKSTMGDLTEAVEAGSTFSEALAQHPKIFPKLFINMVRAGEAGGVLDVTLNRLAEFMEKAQRIKNKVVSAMVYPSVVIVVALGIVGFLMTVVVPKFEEIFRDLLSGAQLPGLTRGVMGVSRVMKSQFLFVLVGVAVLVVLLKILGKTDQGRFIIDKVKLKAPVFGQLIQKVSIARFTRTLGTLIASGVPILQALNIVRETSGNAVVSRAVGQVHDAVKEGERIVQPLESSGIFPPMVISMVDVGEETGALPDMLMKIADVYDDEVDNAVTSLTSLLEPIMIVFLAFIVGTIVIALFLPLIQIIGTLGG
ncbi:type II secretion system F family protein [bacterium]|nr:type II secretion system F family protein [bacterium]